MAKSVHDDVLDGAVGYFETNCDKLTICSAEPASYAEATTQGSVMLAEVTLDGGDFAVANGDGGGRKVTVSAQNSVEVLETGSGTHIALVDTGNSKLLLVTTMTTKAMTDGDYCNVPAFDFEIGDPT